VTEIVSTCQFVAGGQELVFEADGIPALAGIETGSRQWVAIRRDEGLLIVPEEYLEVNKP